MAIGYGRLSPVKKAGTAIGRAAHHGGHRLSHGAAGRSAYLSASRVVGNDPEMVTDYTGKFGVEHSELVLPGGGTCDRETLWNAVDAYKTQRETADVAYDFIVAFPHELSFEERKQAAGELARWISDRYQVAVDYGMHLPETHKGSSEKNFHGHYLISARTVSPTGELGKVQRQLNHRVCQQIDEKRGRTERTPTPGKEIRMAWERIANDALERGGHSERVDLHTRNAIPSKHLGAAATRREREATRERSSGLAREIDSFAKEWAKSDKERDLRTPAYVAKQIDGLQREMALRARDATKRIEEIQQQRRAHIEADVRSHIGDMEAWANDAVGQFGRAWKSEDRAQRIRKKLIEIEMLRQPMRAPTVEEATELTTLGRTRSKSNTLIDRAERVAEKLGELDSDVRIEMGDGPMTKKRLTKIEAEIDGHLAKQKGRNRDAGLEMEIYL